MLRVRLRHLEADNTRRREIAHRYRAELPPDLTRITARPGDVGVEHLFVVQHPRRDTLRERLQALGVGTAIQYPVACHLQRAYADYGAGPGSLPITERAVREVFSLPMYPELTDDEAGRVVEAARQALHNV
jgi:dTDP-4-amino-4,6-dideoxygalactose transaminase